ncbi:hypothetical protein [Geobacillus sp. 47C-IIb]
MVRLFGEYDPVTGERLWGAPVVWGSAAGSWDVGYYRLFYRPKAPA